MGWIVSAMNDILDDLKVLYPIVPKSIYGFVEEIGFRNSLNTTTKLFCQKTIYFIVQFRL